MEKQTREQCSKALYDSIRDDLVQEPPRTAHISKLIAELVDGLCKFVPSKARLHAKIKEDILPETVDIEAMPRIILGLINWIEKFQAPVCDTVTSRWRNEFETATRPVDFIVKFLDEYYDHVEKVYKEVWDARTRLVNNESVVPPEHRPVITGSNGIPDIIKTGR
jgi:hypothetical protein